MAKHKGYLPSLNRLTELSETSSEALAKFQGNLGLNGLTSPSDVAAEALAKHEGDIYFNQDQLPPSASKIFKDAGH